jgi:hypothetical protein
MGERSIGGETRVRSPGCEQFPIKLSEYPGLRTRKPYNSGCFDGSAIIKGLKAASVEAGI